MCTLNDILRTEVRSYDAAPTAKQGMSKERIRFNTDVMFALAKRLELPLDSTAELMRRHDGFSRLYRSFIRRHEASASDIAKELSLTLS
jgi:hypothetical protein